MRIITLVLAGLFASVAGLFAQPATTASPQVSAEVFFEPTRFLFPKLSPDGSKLCVLTPYDDTRYDESHYEDVRYELTMIELPSKKPHILFKGDSTSVRNFWWKSDDLLVILIKVDAITLNLRALDLRTGKMHQFPFPRRYFLLELLHDLPSDPEQMLFIGSMRDSLGEQREVVRINIRTGQENKLEGDREGLTQWLTDPSGTVTAGWGRNNERHFLLWRATPTEKWQYRRFPPETLPDFVPLAVAPDQRRLIVKDYRGHPTARICYYDSVDEKMEEVAAAREVEPERVLLWGHTKEPAAIVYETDREQCLFLNPIVQGHHAWLEKSLPASSLDYVSFSRDNSRAIVFASNDRNPGVYCAANFATQKLTVLGSVSRSINPEKMVKSRHFSFTASDGLTITGRVTLPAGVEKPPLIVRIGADPARSRSSSSFDHPAQFFASRGYATVQINHRGTRGFGRDFLAAGDFQSRTGIARDITEGVAWLEAQGWIDGNRVAVMATNRGGPTASSLAVNSPGRFRVLLTLSAPPADYKGSALSHFAFSGRSERDLIAAIGGENAASAFLNANRSFADAEHLPVPSFHSFGVAAGQGFISDSTKLEKILQKRPQPYEIVVAKNLVTRRKEKISEWQDQARVYDAAASFLDRHLLKTAGP